MADRRSTMFRRPLGNSVGICGEGCQARAINDRDDPALGPYKGATFEGMQRGRHAGAPDRQLDGDEIVRQRDRVSLAVVVAHEYPPREALVYGVHVVDRAV